MPLAQSNILLITLMIQNYAFGVVGIKVYLAYQSILIPLLF